MLTNLIFASFTFIFFALEGAIMAQGLGVPLPIGYAVSTILILPHRVSFAGVMLAAGVCLSLIAQIAEQVDYLRFTTFTMKYPDISPYDDANLLIY